MRASSSAVDHIDDIQVNVNNVAMMANPRMSFLKLKIRMYSPVDCSITVMNEVIVFYSYRQISHFQFEKKCNDEDKTIRSFFK